MIVNGSDLLKAKPIYAMFPEKHTAHGVSYGLSEAGYDIRIKQEITLHPFRRFSLASSMERFQMPDDLVGIVHDKSTHIRRQLLVGNSVVEPGWSGWLTIELFYTGWRPLTIPARTGIAQVIFHRLSDRRNYSGKYSNQPDHPVEAILS